MKSFTLIAMGFAIGVLIAAAAGHSPGPIAGIAAVLLGMACVVVIVGMPRR